jgi:hypothetical protein
VTSAPRASRVVEVLASMAATFTLNVVLAPIGWIATDSERN